MTSRSHPKHLHPVPSRAGPMRVRFAVTSIVFTLLSIGSAAAQDGRDAMTFTLVHSERGVVYGEGLKDFIYADGSIQPDTAKKFQEFIAGNRPSDPHATVVLNSPGGDLAGSLEFGRAIRKMHYWTAVGAALPTTIGVSPSVPKQLVPYLRRPIAPPFPGACYAACTLAYLGGEHRFMDYGSEFGVSAGTEPSSSGAAAPGGEIGGYVAEMGVAPELLARLSQGGRLFGRTAHPAMTTLIKLKVVTPRWITTARVENQNGTAYLGIYTSDQWGEQEMDFSCFTPPGHATLLALTFHLDPGPRAKAADLVNAVQKYVIEFDSEMETLPNAQIISAPSVDAKGRLTATARLPLGLASNKAVISENHIGIAFQFDPKSNLPMQALRLVSDFPGPQLNQFVTSTCH